MKKLFLTSSFLDTSLYLKDFFGDHLEGKTVAFIPTASLVEEYTGYVVNDKNAFIDLGILVNELDITHSNPIEIAKVLSKSDFIYVSGGNTFYLMQELIRSKAAIHIKEQIEKGKLYIGASAGSIILSKNIEYIEQVDDKSKAPELEDFAGLGLIDFYPLPHYGNEPFADVVAKIYEDYQAQIPLIPISNTQVIEVNGESKTIKGALQ